MTGKKPVSIYVLKDSATGEVRYIGKSVSPKDRYSGHLSAARNGKRYPVSQWIAKNGTPIMEVIMNDVINWECEEKRLIKEYREKGYRLLNVADGGVHIPLSKEKRTETGRTLSKRRNKRLWQLTRDIGISLKQGYGSERLKEKMRSRPDVFGQFAWWYEDGRKTE